MCEVTPYMVKVATKAWHISYIPQHGAFDLNHRCGIYILYTTFTPHFKGKRRCITGIIALLSVLRNALTRNGGGIIYTSYIPPRSDITCIYYLLFSLMQSNHSQKSFDFFDETV